MYKGTLVMPSPVAFDTLAYANKLKAASANANVAEAQAEVTATAEILNELIVNKFATKDDLKKEINEINIETKELIKDVEMRMLQYFLKFIGSAVAILAGLQTLFHFIR